MRARCRSHGAVTIINATATGTGCSLATEGGVEATWIWQDEPGLVFGSLPPVDDRLAQAVFEELRMRRADAPAGANVATSSPVAASRGLKTSSGAAAAMVRAALLALDGRNPDPWIVVDAAVDASLAAQVTLTGAFDDQVAVTVGGCHLTDNAGRRILAALPVQPWEVAIWVPDTDIPKSRVAGVDCAAIGPRVQTAISAAQAGDVPLALTLNGAAFMDVYQAAGLPVSDEPVRAAMQAGALGAGLSGTGPAVAALFPPGERPAIGAVSGGTWMWTHAVAAEGSR